MPPMADKRLFLCWPHYDKDRFDGELLLHQRKNEMLRKEVYYIYYLL
ncbi:hypothetical protein XBKQ1_2230018 [Xenorhabdus bovienii str. kraussei Quebec]|uniref:Uncharacterized protein n=1 Tax=Xenorhabdus bovienii str. kraussei Quebec TaxID=1398203 RepID=A0A077PG75_XENBV|nr:hypothetical protein XBKQ1_2230018 [Xenorhabdus bovienii str. kraussei Quebec]